MRFVIMCIVALAIAYSGQVVAACGALVGAEMWRRQRFIIMQTDNGPEFRSKDVRDWCERHGVRQVFSRPGNPTDNCFIESFNRIFREECPNANYFSSLAEAKQIIGAWRIHYNGDRPQKGLKELTPNQFKHKLENLKDSP